MVAILNEGSFQWMIHQTEGRGLGMVGGDWFRLVLPPSLYLTSPPSYSVFLALRERGRVHKLPLSSLTNALTIVTPYNNSCDTTENLDKQDQAPQNRGKQ